MEFKELNLIEPLLKALEKEGYTNPTPIQEKTIPLLLEGKDVIGIAQTGTGKTAAFVLPILQKLEEKYSKVRATTPKALILAPTRELALQIHDSFKTYGSFLNLKSMSAFGGVGIYPQIKSLKFGVDILIATPGRLLDIMNQGKVNLKDIQFLVLDEADRMLDMGFLKDVSKIISALPSERHSLFFSATMSNEITELTRRFLKNPTRIEVTPQSTPVERIDQCVFFVDQINKNELLLDLISQQKIERAIVFVSAKYKADRIAQFLERNGVSADAIHGNKSQSQRTWALNNFKTGKVKVLVATDIAARGIDIENIGHVINYDMPNEPENYVHRIGRTARAGTEGTAYSFCAAEDRNFLNQIERKIRMNIMQAEHKYHSLNAKNAVGDAAKPKPRGRGRGRGGGGSRFGGSRGGHGRFGGRGNSRGRFGGDDGGRGNSGRRFGREDTRGRRRRGRR